MTLAGTLAWLSGLAFVAPELPPSALIGTAVALHVCDAMFCRLVADNNGHPRNIWTALGLIAGVWAVAVVVLLPRRAAAPPPSLPLR